MPKAKRAKQTDAQPDTNALVREQAGTYRSGDGRFTVQQADTGWFLIDTQQTNEFGQELMRGPFDTLKAVREALPDARSEKPKAATRARSRKHAGKRSSGPRAAEPKPPPPPSWIEQLPAGEAAGVRRLIRALQREGVADAEALVRRDREGMLPAVAARLIERRLDDLVDEVPEDERDATRRLIRRAVEVLTAGGTRAPAPLPGWALVEIGPEPEPRNRRIHPRP